jgi:hypothetical protein
MRGAVAASAELDELGDLGLLLKLVLDALAFLVLLGSAVGLGAEPL